MSEPFVVVVSGSREWTNIRKVYGELDALLKQHGALIVRHGDASRGADRIARLWCGMTLLGEDVTEQRRPAAWGIHGKAAGHIRNGKMLSELPLPDMVLAFPLLCARTACRYMDEGPHWTHGTKDMIELAAKALPSTELRIVDPAK